MHPRVLLLGAGGHALVCAEVLRAGGWEVGGWVAREAPAGAALARLGVGRVEPGSLPRLVPDRFTSVFVAIGDNSARASQARRVSELGGRLVRALSPAATVSPSAQVDAGVLVMPGVIVNALARVGEGVILNSGAVVEHECRIGDFAHVAPGVTLAGDVTVGAGALVGAGASVAPGCSIGVGAVVGAGAAVVDDVPDGVTVVGVPARPLVGRA